MKILKHMNSMLKGFIFGFCVAGSYGLVEELFGYPPQNDPKAFVSFWVLVLAMFLINEIYAKVTREELISEWSKSEEEDRKRRLKRIMTIQKICNRNMKIAEGKNRLSPKAQIFVPYEDLIKIWDNADHLRYSE